MAKKEVKTKKKSEMNEVVSKYQPQVIDIEPEVEQSKSAKPAKTAKSKAKAEEIESIEMSEHIEQVKTHEVREEHHEEAAIAVVEQEKRRPKQKRWYIVHTYSGHENKVKVNLEKRIEFMDMGDKIFRVEVPEKTVSKVKDGKRVDKEEKLFPGYVLVEMIMDDDSWYVVRHTPGVTKFVGAERKPIPAKDSEIKKILRRTQAKVTKVEIDINIGDKVRIISGPFADFVGDVTEVYPDKEKLRANVSIFGRDTPVELEYNQIQKV